MLPIRIKQFPRFILQTIQRTFVLRRNYSLQPTFTLCYFSCESYFSYLYCALHSLRAISDDISIKVIVFSDTDQPISDGQIVTLKGLIPEIRVIPWPKSMGWGTTQIESIWRAYALAAENASDDDIIARVDSDVFFFNDRIFKAVERSKADLVGDGHYVNFEYCQGGCYFFRAKAIRKITRLVSQNSMEILLSRNNISVEDIAAYYFAKCLNMKIWLTWFMMFPDELRNAEKLGGWERWKFSCIHFVMKNKSAMLTTYEKEILDSRSGKDFRSAIENY